MERDVKMQIKKCLSQITKYGCLHNNKMLKLVIWEYNPKKI